MAFPLLSTLLIVPLIGVALLVLMPRDNKELLKWIALVTTLVNLVISLPLYFNFVDRPGYQFEEFAAWIPSFNIGYHVGIDGLSLFLVLLTTFLSAVAVLSSWTAITEQVKEYMALMLFLETAMIGVFHPDGFADRPLGRRTTSLRLDQIYPLHDGRQRPDAGRGVGRLSLGRYV